MEYTDTGVAIVALSVFGGLALFFIGIEIIAAFSKADKEYLDYWLEAKVKEKEDAERQEQS